MTHKGHIKIARVEFSEESVNSFLQNVSPVDLRYSNPSHFLYLFLKCIRRKGHEKVRKCFNNLPGLEVAHGHRGHGCGRPLDMTLYNGPEFQGILQH